MIENRLEFTPATQETFSHLREIGTEGSVPGVHALQNQEEMEKRADGIPVALSLDGSVIGAMTFASTAIPDHWTTVTYIKGGFHTPELSKLLKDTAHSVAQQHGFRYVVFVQPDNQYAINSMAKVWPDATVLRTADGTLGYVPNGKAEAQRLEKLEGYLTQELGTLLA